MTKPLSWKLVRNILVLFGIFTIIVAGSTSLYFSLRSSAVSYFNHTAATLGYPQIESFWGLGELGINVISPLTRLSAMVDTEFKLATLGELEIERQRVTDEFDRQVKDYISKAQTYRQIELGFLPTDLTSIPLSQKTQPQKYLSTLKTQFRLNVEKFNQTAKSPIRYVLDPKSKVAEMSLEQKVGQLFGFGISGTSLGKTDNEFLRKYSPGSVVLFASNVDKAKLKQLTTAIQITSPAIPVWVSADQEGGAVKRLKWDTTPSQKSMSTKSYEEVCALYKQRDDLLFDYGVNWNLGIVADTTANPASFIFNRVFGGDPQKVAGYVKKAIDCTNKTISTLKHFPGHGATAVDTHQSIGQISGSRSSWEKNHLVPFQKGIEAKVDTVMMGHLILEWLDGKQPASLSNLVIKYLRDNLKFGGVVVSDDMLMLERSGKSRAKSLESALKAGNDILLYALTGKERDAVMQSAIRMVKEGVILEADVDTRVERILNMKNKTVKAASTFIPSSMVY